MACHFVSKVYRVPSGIGGALRVKSRANGEPTFQQPLAIGAKYGPIPPLAAIAAFLRINGYFKLTRFAEKCHAANMPRKAWRITPQFQTDPLPTAIPPLTLCDSPAKGRARFAQVRLSGANLNIAIV